MFELSSNSLNYVAKQYTSTPVLRKRDRCDAVYEIQCKDSSIVQSVADCMSPNLRIQLLIDRFVMNASRIQLAARSEVACTHMTCINARVQIYLFGICLVRFQSV